MEDKHIDLLPTDRRVLLSITCGGIVALLLVRIKYKDYVHSFINFKLYGIERYEDDIILGLGSSMNVPFPRIVSYREFLIKDAGLFINWYWMSTEIVDTLYGR
jgi:hypothetical protein